MDHYVNKMQSKVGISRREASKVKLKQRYNNLVMV